MQYCSHCGKPVRRRIPPGDNLPRYVCDACGTVHYQNPNIVAGALLVSSDQRILICRRAIEPRHGFWTLPAGFMENGESVEEAALRETREEARANAVLDALLALVNVPDIGQVHMMYRGRLTDDEHSPGPESLETRLVAPDEIPWDALAFPSVRFTLERYLDDLGHGEFRLHSTVIRRHPAD